MESARSKMATRDATIYETRMHQPCRMRRPYQHYIITLQLLFFVCFSLILFGQSTAAMTPVPTTDIPRSYTWPQFSALSTLPTFTKFTLASSESTGGRWLPMQPNNLEAVCAMGGPVNETTCVGGAARWVAAVKAQQAQQQQSTAVGSKQAPMLKVHVDEIVMLGPMASYPAALAVSAVARYTSQMKWEAVALSATDFLAGVGVDLVNVVQILAAMNTSDNNPSGWTQVHDRSSPPLIDSPALLLNGVHQSNQTSLKLDDIVRPGVILQAQLPCNSSSTASCVRRVGVVSLPVDQLRQITNIEQRFGPLESDDPVVATTRQVARITDAGVNIIVLLCPSVYTPTLYQQISSIPQIDVVVFSVGAGGSPSSFLSTSVSGSPMLWTSCSQWFQHLCLAQVEFDEHGVLTAAELSAHGIVGTMPLDPPLNAMMQSDYASIATASQIMLGFNNGAEAVTNLPLPYVMNRFNETHTGNIIADAIRWGGRAQVGLINSGAVRSLLPLGNLTLARLQTTLPFGDSIILVSMTGDDLWSCLEHSVSLAETDPLVAVNGRGRFMQVSGIRMSWAPQQPIGQRISYVEVLTLPSNQQSMFEASFNTGPTTTTTAAGRYVPLDLLSTYLVAMPQPEFVGGDGYSFPNSRVLNNGVRLGTEISLLEAYLQRYSPMTDTLETIADSTGTSTNTLLAHRIIKDPSRVGPNVTALTPAIADIAFPTLLAFSGTNLLSPSALAAAASSIPNYWRNTTITVWTAANGTIDALQSSNLVSQVCDVVSASVDGTLIQCVLPVLSDRQLQSLLGSISASTRVSLPVRIFIDTGDSGGRWFSAGQSTLLTRSQGQVASECLAHSQSGTGLFSGVCDCRAGFRRQHTSGAGATTTGTVPICLPCEPGSISPDQSDVCFPCLPGFFTSSAASTSCQPCPDSTYAATNGSTTCTRCPPFSSTDLNRVPTRSQCFCQAGYVESQQLESLQLQVQLTSTLSLTGNSSVPSSAATTGTNTDSSSRSLSCVSCPSGASCTPQGLSALSGYWYDVTSQTFYQCPQGQCCVGDSPCLIAQPSALSSHQLVLVANDSAVCAAEREGFMCSNCIPGYSLTTATSEGLTSCIPCTKADASLIFGFAALLLGYFTFSLLGRSSSSPVVKVGLDYLQMLLLVLLSSSLGIRENATEVLQLFQLRVDSFFHASNLKRCAFYASPVAQIALQALYGPVCLCLCLVAWLLWRASRACCGCHSRFFPQWRFQQSGWQLLLMSFMGMVRGCISLLHCTSYGNRFVLYQAPTVTCWSSEHWPYAIAAIVLSILLCLLIPSALFVFLLRLHRRGLLQADPSSQATSDPKTIASIEQLNGDDADDPKAKIEQVQLSHGVLFLCYASDYWWFEPLFLWRRVLFVLPFALLESQPSLLVCGFFCLALLVFHLRTPVFKEPYGNQLHASCLLSIVGLCWIQGTRVVGTANLLPAAWVLLVLPVVVLIGAHPSLRPQSSQIGKNSAAQSKSIDIELTGKRNPGDDDGIQCVNDCNPNSPSGFLSSQNQNQSDNHPAKSTSSPIVPLRAPTNGDCFSSPNRVNQPSESPNRNFNSTVEPNDIATDLTAVRLQWLGVRTNEQSDPVHMALGAPVRKSPSVQRQTRPNSFRIQFHRQGTNSAALHPQTPTSLPVVVQKDNV